MTANMAMLAVFLGMSLTLGLGGLAFAGGGRPKRFGRRLELLRERHSTSQEVMAQVQMRRIVSARTDGKFDNFIKRFVPRPAELRSRLDRTGRTITVERYASICAILTASVFIGLEIAGTPVLLAVFAALAVGVGLPHKIVGSMISRRTAAFTNRFPDAIDLLVRGLRSGLPVSESLSVVGKELPDPVGMEFRMVSDKIRIGRTMEQALQEMALRVRTAEFQFFVITLSIQRETGGNLAETLHNLGSVLRNRSQMKLKIKSMSSESKASAYILGSMPALVALIVTLANPNYLAGFLVDPRLMIAAGAGAVWMSIGAFIMAKMIAFEI